jgi:hypothetical protein
MGQSFLYKTEAKKSRRRQLTGANPHERTNERGGEKKERRKEGAREIERKNQPTSHFFFFLSVPSKSVASSSLREGGRGWGTLVSFPSNEKKKKSPSYVAAVAARSVWHIQKEKRYELTFCSLLLLPVEQRAPILDPPLFHLFRYFILFLSPLYLAMGERRWGVSHQLTRSSLFLLLSSIFFSLDAERITDKVEAFKLTDAFFILSVVGSGLCVFPSSSGSSRPRDGQTSDLSTLFFSHLFVAALFYYFHADTRKKEKKVRVQSNGPTRHKREKKNRRKTTGREKGGREAPWSDSG